MASVSSMSDAAPYNVLSHVSDAQFDQPSFLSSPDPVMLVLSDETINTIASRTAEILSSSFMAATNTQISTASTAASYVESDMSQAFWRTTMFLFWICMLVLWVRVIILTFTKVCCFMRGRRHFLRPPQVAVAVPSNEKKLIESEV